MIIKITLRKVRSTWHWTSHNEQGGSFSSNHCGSKKVALHTAAQGVKAGEVFLLETNGQSEGLHTVDGAGKVVKVA